MVRDSISPAALRYSVGVKTYLRTLHTHLHTRAGVGRNEDDDLEEEEETMYAAASPKEGGEGDADAIVDWRHEEKLFDERHYLTGLLWNVQMYIDGYCPDYQFAYRCVARAPCVPICYPHTY